MIAPVYIAPVYIALGANLPFGGLSGGDLLRAALARLAAEGVPVRASSRIWESPAWPPGRGQPPFVNAAAEIDPAGRDPQALFALLLEVERAFGRERGERWGPRTLDLDIVDYAGLVGEEGGLILPHPRAHERAFVLGPMGDVAPAWRHPVLGKTAAELLADMGGPGEARPAEVKGA